jgi:hypothetical protein
MKKLYSVFKKENVQAVAIIGGVFLIVGLVAVYIIFNQFV